ncbi:MAG: SIR2 family protein, partial [Burkholderiales bacterium]
GTPSFAHRVLASFITTGEVPCAFTTNFDPLVEQAATVTDQKVPAGQRANLTVAAIDNPDRARLAFQEARPFLAKLHGDYQSVELMNTPDELQEQDVHMRAVLRAACGRFGLIIVGYSGRDHSVMKALTDAIAQENAFPGGIYWVTSDLDGVLPAVRMFLEAANAARICTAFVQCQNFDELAGDIADGVEFPDQLKQHIFQGRPDPILVEVPLPTRPRHKFPILQCSAVPVLVMPAAARRITLSTPTTTKDVKQLLRKAEVRAVVSANGLEIAVFGTDDELLKGLRPLKPVLAGTIDLHPDQDSWARGLLHEALTVALTRERFLFMRRRHSRYLILAARGADDQPAHVRKLRERQQAPLRSAYDTRYKKGDLYGIVPELNFPFAEGVQTRLEHINGQWWYALEPTTYVELPRMEAEEGNAPNEEQQQGFFGDPVLDWRRERWATRYNAAWAQIIAAWVKFLIGDGNVSAMGVDHAQGVDATFQVSPVTGWSRPGNDHPYFRR